MQEGIFTQSVLYRFASQWNANHYLVLLSYREESKLSRVVTGLKLQNKFLHSDLMVSNAFSKMIKNSHFGDLLGKQSNNCTENTSSQDDGLHP